MFKKIVIGLVVLILVGMAFLPTITSHMAESAFENPNIPANQKALKKAIQWKMYMFMYGQALPIAERAIILCPESDDLDFYIYSAAICADKERKSDVAIHWYGRFIELFPKEHDWYQQAKNHYNKLKAMQDEETK